jgi:hypothetical protein
MADKTLDEIFLNRDADAEGNKLCAMSAIAKKLGYTPLTDMPKEVDPGLAALVNLLNDRANDRARQLLVARLDAIPNSGKTEIFTLIGSVYFPQMFEGYGVKDKTDAALHDNGQQPTAKSYTSLGMRLLEPDGAGIVARGCLIYAAALNADDPTERDVLAVSAASQLVSFETGDGWFELLYILDYMLGMSESPDKGGMNSPASLRDYKKYFREEIPASEAPEKPDLIAEEEKGPIQEVYDLGVTVRWFPALVQKFPDRLEEIAAKILDEVAEIGNKTIYMHRFPFGGEEVMIATSWDDDLDMLFADADLVAYLDPVGEIDLDGDGESVTIMNPIPASGAGSIH